MADVQMASVTAEESAPSAQSSGGAPSKSITELVQLKQWLLSQRNELRAVLREAETPTDFDDENSADIELVEERVRKYEEDLVSKSCDNLVQQQLLERTQLSSTLIKVLFPGEYGSVNEETRKKILEHVDVQNEVSSQLMKSHKEFLQLKKEYNSLRKERSALMTRNRELMGKLKQHQEAEDNPREFPDDPQIQRAREAMEEEIKKAKLIAGIFQGCIVGSGVHWAADEKLMNLVMELDQPVERLLSK